MNDQDKKQSDTHAHSVVPRKAVFKVRGNTAGVIDKKELIAYPANALSSHLNVGANDTNKKITFLLSGDCFVDGMESYVSLRLKVNKYTAYLSSDVTSIVKRLVLSLPSNSNQVLEDINEYATLQSILHQANGSDEAFAANWHSGQNCLANYNKESGAASARRFLNMGDEGEYRTLTFQLNLSGILSSQNYLPLMLLNGLKLDLHLSSASEAFHYDATKEASWDTVFACVEAPFAKNPNLDQSIDRHNLPIVLSTYQRSEEWPDSAEMVDDEAYLEKIHDLVRDQERPANSFEGTRKVGEKESIELASDTTRQLEALRAIAEETKLGGGRRLSGAEKDWIQKIAWKGWDAPLGDSDNSDKRRARHGRSAAADESTAERDVVEELNLECKFSTMRSIYVCVTKKSTQVMDDGFVPLSLLKYQLQRLTLLQVWKRLEKSHDLTPVGVKTDAIFVELTA